MAWTATVVKGPGTGLDHTGWGGGWLMVVKSRQHIAIPTTVFLWVVRLVGRDREGGLYA